MIENSAASRSPGLRGAPERARRGIGVLVVLGRAVRVLERRARAPLLADPLALDRSGDVGRQRQAVVLVALLQRAVSGHAQEVQGHVEVLGGEVREAQGRGLVRDAERVAEVLDREPLLLLGLREERHRCVLRHEARRGEVVDLETLPEELDVARGRRVPEQPVGHRLQRHRPQAVAARDRRRRQVDATVGEVGDRPGRVGQVVHVDELEAEPLGHDAHLAVGEGARAVARRGDLLFGELLDLGQVVGAVAHALAQLGVGAARLFGRRDRLARPPLQLTVQADDRRERVVGDAAARADRGKPEGRVERARLRPAQFELERGTPTRRLAGEQLGEFDVERGGEGVERRQLRLALAVLDERELAAGQADRIAQLVEREAALAAEVTDAMPQRREVG